MAFGRIQTLRSLYRTVEIRNFSLLGSSRSYSNVGLNDLNCWRSSSRLGKGQNTLPLNFTRTCCQCISCCSCKGSNALPWTQRDKMRLRSTMAAELLISLSDTRLVTTQAKPAPPQGQRMGAFKVSMLSPGIVYEPYARREPISFWNRWFTRNGWKRTKEELILELKSAYAIAKLRKYGYSKQKFYNEAAHLYKQINTQMANGDKKSLRKEVTENMYSALKNEIKQRESIWSTVHWELIEPVVNIRTLRARLISVDPKDLSKVFIQLTLEILAKQRFEAYDSKGAVVTGDKNKEVLVRDIWVFEKSLFHPGAYWRLCGRIST